MNEMITKTGTAPNHWGRSIRRSQRPLRSGPSRKTNLAKMRRLLLPGWHQASCLVTSMSGFATLFRVSSSSIPLKPTFPMPEALATASLNMQSGLGSSEALFWVKTAKCDPMEYFGSLDDARSAAESCYGKDVVRWEDSLAAEKCEDE